MPQCFIWVKSTPSLFDKELYPKNVDLTSFITKLAKFKKRKIFASGIYQVNIPEIDGVAYLSYSNNLEEIHGIFNVGLKSGNIKVNLPDARYRNYLTNKYVKVSEGLLKLSKDPIIIKLKK